MELKIPIRLYWDLPASPSAAGLDYPDVCAQIAALKILSLAITETSGSLSDGCLAILERLNNHPIAVSLTVAPGAVDPARLAFLQALNVRQLLIRAADADDLQSVARLRNGAGAKPPLGVSFEADADNYRLLPEVLSFCVENDIQCLVLPMQRLKAGADCFRPDRSERDELCIRLAGIKRPSTFKITIHDPFLWRVFFPSIPFPDGSCQAANTMLHIAGNGDVHPCPTLPYRLGNLMNGTLRAIVESAQKKELRERLTRPPVGCAGCAELEQCRGGCRGRGYFLTRTLDGADPGCR